MAVNQTTKKIISKSGCFVISLDFELYWGIRSSDYKDGYIDNLIGVTQVIPKLLSLFEKYNIRATWAIVGFLFYSNIKELLENLPLEKPEYINSNLSPYKELETLNWVEESNSIYSAKKLIELIRAKNGQEIGTHTFSHYYTLEEGASKASFIADLEKSLLVSRNHGIQAKSIIFPRNQINPDYLKICSDLGIKVYRGNESSWYYNCKTRFTLLSRALRLLDSYINISGMQCYAKPNHLLFKDSLINIPSSKFLRPYSRKLSLLEPLKIKRIKDMMTYAAKNKKIFHLWWHPHNFGVNQHKNLNALEKILIHYADLNKRFNFNSYNLHDFIEVS